MAAGNVKKSRRGTPVRGSAQADHSRRKRRRRRGRRTIHFVLVLLFALAAGTVLSLTVFFKIEDVIVTGCDKYPPDEIAAASGILEGDNLLRIDKEAISGAILEQFPYIETVEVHRRFPPKVELEVTQSTPDAAIALSSGYLLITRDGKVLERGTMILSPDIPIVTGLEAGDLEPGDFMGEESAEALDMLDKLTTSLERVDFGEITNVDLTNLRNMRIAYEGRLDLLLGSEADLDYKLEFISAVLELLEPDARGVVNAADAALDKKIVFSPRDPLAQQHTFENSGDAVLAKGGEEVDPTDADDDQQDAE